MGDTSDSPLTRPHQAERAAKWARFGSVVKVVLILGVYAAGIMIMMCASRTTVPPYHP